MNSREQQELKNKIRALLETIDMNSFDVEGSVSEHADGKLSFTLESRYSTTLKFAEMDKLSSAFQTKEMDFTDRAESYGYCETCRGTEEIQVVQVYNAVVE